MNWKAISVLGCVLAASGCQKAETTGGTVETANVKQDLQLVAGHRILFGHQSVGQNILDGLKELAAREGVPLRVEEVAAPAPGDSQPGIEHFHVGQNRNPGLKCEDFLRRIGDAGAKYDILVLKFCFEDVSAQTDVPALFKQYQDFSAQVETRFPKAVFVHCTVPLRASPAGLRTKVKRLIGKETEEDADNVKRNEFNELLRKAYAGKAVFDIAQAESTLPDGSRSFFKQGGNVYYTLADAYSRDGGHLTTLGKARLAGEFTRTLAAWLRAGRS